MKESNSLSRVTDSGDEIPDTKVLAQKPDISPIVQGKCPKVSVHDDKAFYRIYTDKNEGDPSQIVYQASLVEATRSCTISDNQLKINAVVAGRLLAGPQGKSGRVKLPIRVVVTDKVTKSVYYSQLTVKTVNLTGPVLTTQFVFNDPRILIPLGAGGETQIHVSFEL